MYLIVLLLATLVVAIPEDRDTITKPWTRALAAQFNGAGIGIDKSIKAQAASHKEKEAANDTENKEQEEAKDAPKDNKGNDKPPDSHEKAAHSTDHGDLKIGDVCNPKNHTNGCDNDGICRDTGGWIYSTYKCVRKVADPNEECQGNAQPIECPVGYSCVKDKWYQLQRYCRQDKLMFGLRQMIKNVCKDSLPENVHDKLKELEKRQLKYQMDAESGTELVALIKKLQESTITRNKRPIFADPSVVNDAYRIWHNNPRLKACNGDIVDVVFDKGGCMRQLPKNAVAVELRRRQCLYTNVRCVEKQVLKETSSDVIQRVLVYAVKTVNQSVPFEKRIISTEIAVNDAYHIMFPKEKEEGCRKLPNDPDTSLGARFAVFRMRNVHPVKVECIF